MKWCACGSRDYARTVVIRNFEEAFFRSKAGRRENTAASFMNCGHGPFDPLTNELSPNLGDGLRDQAAAVWDCEDAGLAATSIPSVNLTP